MNLEFDRRSILGGVGIAAGMASLSGCAEGMRGLPFMSGSGQAPGLDTVEDQIKNILRMSASLEPEDCPWSFNGTIYGVVEGEQPRPLFDFQGMEVYFVTQISENEYEMTGNTVTYFKDVETKEFIYDFENPYTGKKIDVPASVQGGGPGRGFTYEPTGIRPTFLKDRMPDAVPNLDWHIVANKVWVHSTRSYPPGMTPPRAERQTTFADKKEFDDPSVAKLSSVFSSTFFVPWLKWFEMGDRPGHMVWHAGGAKLDGFDDLPAEYKARVEKEYPERMTGKPEAGTGGKKVE
jgi:hypothetical protein